MHQPDTYLLKLENTSSSAQAKQISVRFVCVYVSSTLPFIAVFNRFSRCLDHGFRSFRSLFEPISIDYKTLELNYFVFEMFYLLLFFLHPLIHFVFCFLSLLCCVGLGVSVT